MRRCFSNASWLPILLLCLSPAAGAEADRYFTDEVWAKVGAQSCLKCHKTGGDAEESRFVLQDPARDPSPERHVSLQHNRAAFARMAAARKGRGSRLLLKSIGELDHEGKDVLKRESAEYRILAEFVRRMDTPGEKPLVERKEDRPFFEGVVMLDDRRLLRRITLSLAARLPTAREIAAVEKGGLKAITPVLDEVMKEEAFYERLAEGFNDIFLTRGYDDLPERVLSYEHFTKTRNWVDKHDLSHIADPAERRKAGYKMTADYREAILREPMELIKYMVRHDRPFAEIVTADYIMVSPYTARGYGVFDEVRGKFKDVDDPFEYVPVRLKALVNRSGKVQESATGFYPHAGFLTLFQWIKRYPTTETNRNRLRARMYYQHFLGIDVLELAARVSDAAAVSVKHEVPTMQAAECVVCHKTIDPVAGLFQDYYSLSEGGLLGPRKEGWFTDMFAPGLEGEDLPPAERWRSLQWLGERTAKDPRFAATMVEHVYYILTGRKVLLPPKDLDDPLYDAKQRAYQAQRQEIEGIAARFAKADFNLKSVFKEWVVSPFYRADGLETAAADARRLAELSDLGLARMLGPEQVERKVTAIFGQPWGRLNNKELSILYGGIDAKEVTERAADPSGAMGAIQRILANDVACKNVALDFTTEPAQRRLFPKIEPDDLPGVSPEGDGRIREAIAFLHHTVLGQNATADDPEVRRTFDLFAGIVSEARERKGIDPQEIYSGKGAGNQRVKDPHYTLRAWRGVVTYLLRQPDFLYE
ncbi:MAG TPA: hypothetical protein VD994_03385 [Prosthecobacter sp.]|nr:hypothetical protein [Prosthecobacter sp.]